MRPAAPVKMTSGIYVLTSMGMVDRDSRPRTHLSARLTASPSTRKYLEPFQILASAGADCRRRPVAAGAFLTPVPGRKTRGFEGGVRRAEAAVETAAHRRAR